MSAVLGFALAFGALLGLGLWSLVAMTPRLRAQRLADRLAPYLVDVSEEARRSTEKRLADPIPVLGRLVSPPLYRATVLLSRVLGGSAAIERWLSQSGSRASVQDYRVRQVLSGLAGLGAGALLSVVLVTHAAPVATVVLPVVGAVTGIVCCDVLLRRRAASRVARITEEVPTVLEFIGLTLSAGEGVVDALRRVARVGSGELSREFAAVLADTGAGVPLVTALSDCARRTGSPPLTRAVEQLCAAMEHGAPIAEVLRAQAHDAREDAKRRLLEAAGRKEVTMLIPLVLLILPLSIAFALLPGLFVLRAGF
ncbi:tight adherence protein C [Paramicrobacterium humi]|uniref:Tight adherence protein C n=1 Tax=Paramicrobacterium humi TaxID=640635 RepID=A0A1H4TD38_9MICO|nr:type II secretion system F family protein [Microbacterium humi]SEC54247.1 tight adherence protein C [Microbacterium humi]